MTSSKPRPVETIPDHTLTIPLTGAQTDSADWLLGCPLFVDETAETVAEGWDETPENAARIVAAAARCRREGRTLILAADADVLESLVGDARRLASMSANEYLDDLLVKGCTHQQAQCRANGAVRSANALADRLDAALTELRAKKEAYIGT